MRYFLGIDIGNTKSHALLAGENGTAVGFGLSGPGSWEAIGWQGARATLYDITMQVISHAEISKEDIWGAGFGFAGYDWPEDRPGHEALIASLDLPNAKYVLGNDTLVGLMAGTNNGWGVVVIAGTSNNCRGWDRNGREGRVTGQGAMFGEYGGASEIVDKAVQAISLEWSMRGPKTSLSRTFVHLVGASDVADLLAGLVRGRYKLSAANAPVVFELADQGDEVAQEIIHWAGRELGGLALGVIHQLELENQAFDVVLSGSIYKGSPKLRQVMRQTIHAVAPGATLLKLMAPPVTGGVLLGMGQIGLNTNLIRPVLIESTNKFVSSMITS